MRPTPNERLEKIRMIEQELAMSGGTGVGKSEGVFGVYRNGTFLRMIASASLNPAEDYGWEHVSVSTKNRCPNWNEMCFVKDLFWLPEEAVMQIHPPESEYVNNHEFCLHLWRPTMFTIPLPPAILVGVKSAGVLKTVEEALALRKSVLNAE